MRGSVRGRRVARIGVMAAVVAVLGAMGGTAASAVLAPLRAAADCGMQAPDPRIEAHRGFAFDGVIEDITGRVADMAGWQDRITMRVTEALAGSPGPIVAFDLGRGPCSLLQGDRYKVGDRLIVTASAPPTTGGDVAHLADVLTWRHEWADTWSFHGLDQGLAKHMPAAYRAATTRDAILRLVAPDALPYAVAPDAWTATLQRSSPRQLLTDVVPWGDGFVAFGWASAEPQVPQVWRSPDGRRWTRSTAALPDIQGRTWNLQQLVSFRGDLYLVGGAGEFAVALRSGDGGRTWGIALSEPLGDPRPVPGTTLPPVGDIRAAATADRLLLLAGTGGATSTRAFTTTDGEHWDRDIPTQLGPWAHGLLATPDTFVITDCGQSGPTPTCTLQTSPDGIAWSLLGAMPVTDPPVAWDAAGSRYLAAVGNTHAETERTASLQASSDATTWETLVTAPGIASDAWAAAASDDGTLALLGRGDAPGGGWWTMTSSDDGATWTWSPIPTGERACLDKIAIGTSRIVAVGGCGRTVGWVADR
ncbi:MAG: hypothetical protein U0869_21030 [Chloroflexota bacterium]